MASGSRTEESAIKLDVNITKLDDSSPVFFKVDGERFKETQTLKLQVDTTYKVSFEFRPSMEVSEISIAGVNVEHELKRSDERSSYHECAWSTTGMSHSKKKDRLYVVISIKFQDGKELNARVQCKMYAPKDKNHLVWGTCLKNLYMGCRVRDGQSHIDVQQLVFK